MKGEWRVGCGCGRGNVRMASPRCFTRPEIYSGEPIQNGENKKTKKRRRPNYFLVSPSIFFFQDSLAYQQEEKGRNGRIQQSCLKKRNKISFKVISEERWQAALRVYGYFFFLRPRAFELKTHRSWCVQWQGEKKRNKEKIQLLSSPATSQVVDHL